MGKVIRIISFLFLFICFHGQLKAIQTITSVKLTPEQCRFIDTLYFRFSQEFDKESYYNALALSFQIIDTLKAHNDIENLINYYETLLYVFNKMDKDTLIFKYVENLSDYRKLTNDISAQVRIDYYFGKYYYMKKKYLQSIQMLNLCIRNIEKIPNILVRGSVYLQLGDAYANTKQYGLAHYNYRQAIKIYSPGNHYVEMSNAYTKIAHIHQVLNQNQENLEYNQKALNIRKKTNNPKLLSSSLLNVGEAYWLLGMNDSARIYLQRSLEVSLTQRAAYNIEVSYVALKNFCNSTGRYEDAYRYDQKSAEYHTRFLLAKNSTDISILLATRALNEREISNERIKQEILLKNLQIKNKKNQTISLGLSMVACLSLVFFIDFMIRANNRKKKEISALNEKMRLEINANDLATGLLYQSEERHRFLAENTSDVIILLDADLRKIYVTRSCQKLFGYTSRDILKMNNLLELVDFDFQTSFNLHLMEMLQVKQPIQWIYKAIRKDKSDFWAEASFNPVLEKVTKSIQEIILVVRDYSEQKKFEEDLSLTARQKEIMLKEIHNRVKNNFAILGSLVNMVLNQHHGPKMVNAYNDLHLRIRTMSLVHEQLYKSQEISIIPLNSYLQHLCLIIESTFHSDRIEMVAELEPCYLSIENTLPIGLIMNELLINSYKYAFPDNMTGKISIRLFPEKEGFYCIMISDNGIGLPDDFSTRTTTSMGTQIVHLLVQQIDGKLTVTNDHGTCFKLVFPLRS